MFGPSGKGSRTMTDTINLAHAVKCADSASSLRLAAERATQNDHARLAAIVAAMKAAHDSGDQSRAAFRARSASVRCAVETPAGGQLN